MNYSVIITSAGSGLRCGLGYNKLLYKVNDKILLEYCVNKFIDANEIIITSSKNDFDYLKNYFNDFINIKVVLGGNNREESVFNAVKEVKNDIVLITDGARVNVSPRLINDVLESVNNLSENVIPVIKLDSDTSSRRLNDLVVQTPQGFKKDILLKAFKLCEKENKFNEFRDDSSLVYNYYKTPLTLVLGDANNFKITTKEDLIKIENILKGDK